MSGHSSGISVGPWSESKCFKGSAQFGQKIKPLIN